MPQPTCLSCVKERRGCDVSASRGGVQRLDLPQATAHNALLALLLAGYDLANFISFPPLSLAPPLPLALATARRLFEDTGVSECSQNSFGALLLSRSPVSTSTPCHLNTKIRSSSGGGKRSHVGATGANARLHSCRTRLAPAAGLEVRAPELPEFPAVTDSHSRFSPAVSLGADFLCVSHSVGAPSGIHPAASAGRAKRSRRADRTGFSAPSLPGPDCTHTGLALNIPRGAVITAYISVLSLHACRRAVPRRLMAKARSSGGAGWEKGQKGEGPGVGPGRRAQVAPVISTEPQGLTVGAVTSSLPNHTTYASASPCQRPTHLLLGTRQDASPNDVASAHTA
ncbi:hypothetical protein SKAU_G00346960 [Synaphobranchus kaupii]|uniref:Uncharacterized protein n=1 Tax=Synaphobranchus kaupii TaxID=118154 RepID=A0A9Q1IFM9_SYNKA|nr:hypothetical protein SKAU_G00346960 [Synaphobranchus kaupii]